MRTLIGSDNPSASTQLRRALAAHGHECPLSQVVPLQAVEGVQSSALFETDLLLIVLPDNKERAVGIVRSLRTAAPGRVVAVGSAEDAKHILDILHAGADDYLDVSADAVEQVSREVARYAHSTAGVRRGGPLITVAAAAGGAGCTLVAANLAVLLAQDSGSCALVECVSGFGDLSDIFNVEPRHTLADLCRNVDVLDQNMLLQSFSGHESGVRLIIAPRESEEADVVTPPAIERVLSTSCATQPWTIVDADLPSLRSGSLHTSSSLLVLVTRLDLSSLCRTRRLLDELNGRSLESRRVLLVANRCGHRSEIPHSQVPRVLGLEVGAWLPEDAQSAIVAVNCGNPVVLEAPRTALARQLGKLADGIRARFPDFPRSQREPADRAVPPNSSETPALLRRAAGMFF